MNPDVIRVHFSTYVLPLLVESENGITASTPRQMAKVTATCRRVKITVSPFSLRVVLALPLWTLLLLHQTLRHWCTLLSPQ
jgi:hypothetical protein